MNNPRVLILGAGAAGCFCSIEVKRKHPEWDVCVIEKGTKALAKVAITGGGRCNLTNSFRDVKSTKQVYPRGEKLMKRALKVFSHEDTMKWFEHEGVRLVTQDDQCVFPQSQDAMEIVNTLLRLMQRLGVRLITGCKATTLIAPENTETPYRLEADIRKGQKVEPTVFEADYIVVTTGGNPKRAIPFDFKTNGPSLATLSPVPSLFTFNVNDKALQSLTGTVVEDVCVRLIGTKFQSEGPLLITHWGLSGPAILKLSSYGARHLAEKDYKAEVSINWFGNTKEPEVLELLNEMAIRNPRKQLSSIYPEQFCQRHWLYLLSKAGLPTEKRWSEVGTKQMNRLASLLTNDIHLITGKGQFKEEFVTCGGIALENINMNTLECKNYPGLFFAGEVLDVDAITGGFNLQAAWTMGYIVSQNI